MSVTREENRPKNGCPSRGLGIAAVAIGAGVGAALYYFFNKRAEHQSGEGSTDWNNERPEPFLFKSSTDDSYSTISEHDTTDTSMNETADSMAETADSMDDTAVSMNDSADSISDHNDDVSVSFIISVSDSDSETDLDVSSEASDSDSEDLDFDVTSSSLGVPYDDDRSRSPLTALSSSLSSFWEASVSPWRRTHLTEEEQMAMIREEQFRDRSWAVEDCSICFDQMLRHQDLTRLPCSHNFHTECILPWLQEKQTCPYCRKSAE